MKINTERMWLVSKTLGLSPEKFYIEGTSTDDSELIKQTCRKMDELKEQNADYTVQNEAPFLKHYPTENDVKQDFQSRGYVLSDKSLIDYFI